MAHVRETLVSHFPQGGLTERGFRNTTKPGGYALEGKTIYAYYSGQKNLADGNGNSRIRRTLAMTDGEQWFIGGRDGAVPVGEMVTDMLEAIKNGKGKNYGVAGSALPARLAEPLIIPDIEARPREPQSPKLDGVRGHSFE